MIRVVHYLNQFFGQIGGEEEAGVGPSLVEGTVGPGAVLARNLEGAAGVSHTIICGDNYFSEDPERAIGEILELLRSAEPDLVVAGPAFMAGRYGLACGQVGAAATAELGVPAVTGLAPENPAVESFRRQVVIVPTGTAAVDMRNALRTMAAIGVKMAQGAALGPPEEEGYITRGLRRNALDEQDGATRALSMLKAKLAGETVETEVPLPNVQRVDPAPPLADLSDSVVALVTTGGLVPMGNPDHLKSHHSERWESYPIDLEAGLETGKYEAVHGGFYVQHVNDDPNRLLPLDALTSLVEAGELGGVHPRFYTMAGNGTDPDVARTMARAVAKELKAANVDAALAFST